VSSPAADIETYLVEQLASSRKVSITEVADSITATGGIDSLEGVELILVAEEVLGISIPDDALSSRVCRSIPKIAQLLRSEGERREA
jgi:acyl carrier protein